MSNEVATLQESSLDLLPPAQPPSLAARQMLMAHAEMMQTAHQLAVAMCNTQMVPVRFRGKPDDGAAAILYGGELGLNPIQSLQRIIPIHGMPSLEARTMVALLKSRGYKIKVTAKSDTSVTVEGWDLDGEHYESTWTIERATKAGYVPTVDEKTKKYKLNANGKLLGNEKYLTDPQAMLTAKAQSEISREMAPDVLMGISYTSEELESERWDTSALPEPAAPRGSAPVTVDEILGGAAEPKPKPKKAPAAPPPVVEEPVDVEVQEDAPAEQPAPEPVESEAAPAPAPDPEHAEEPAVDPEPASAADEAPKSAKRKALEKRLFKLLGDANLTAEAERENRLTVYRAIVGRTDITTTNDLSDAEALKLADALYAMGDQLDNQITDILNAATLAEESATTEIEGN